MRSFVALRLNYGGLWVLWGRASGMMLIEIERKKEEGRWLNPMFKSRWTQLTAVEAFFLLTVWRFFLHCTHKSLCKGAVVVSRSLAENCSYISTSRWNELPLLNRAHPTYSSSAEHHKLSMSEQTKPLTKQVYLVLSSIPRRCRTITRSVVNNEEPAERERQSLLSRNGSPVSLIFS